MTVPNTEQKSKARRLRRVLAIDPTHRGFGFAVLETPDRLVDWGVACVRRNEQTEYLKRICRLIMIHQPNAVAVEDVDTSRRGIRVKTLIGVMKNLAPRHGVHFVSVPKARSRRTLGLADSATNHDISCAAAERFSELKPILPRKRKCYASEDERSAIFGAIALAAQCLPWRSCGDST